MIYQLLCTLATLALGTPLAKNSWKPLKRSPDGFGFGGHRHHSSHNGGARASSSASSGYGAPRQAAPAPVQAAPSSDYGAAAAPVCRTEYENKCETVNEEKCETVNDQVLSQIISGSPLHDVSPHKICIFMLMLRTAAAMC